MIENKLTTGLFNGRTPFFSFIVLSAFVSFSLLSSEPVFAKTMRYVSDELKIPMRSGASTQHRIIKFLRSGTALTVLDDDDKFTEIEIGDKSGWVLTEDLMNVPSGRDRLVAANNKLTKSRAQVKELKSAIAKLKGETRKLKGEKSSLQNERTNLSNSLDDIKITAANPLSLAKKNKQLKKELSKVRDNEAMLEKDNQQLRSNVMQEWFMIGGAVSIGSLIFGLIITRINWRKKRDSWGDSF